MNELYNIRIIYKDKSVSGFLAHEWLIDMESLRLTASRGPNSYANDTEMSTDLNKIAAIFVDDAILYNYTEHEKGNNVYHQKC